ncbi:MAG: hypothetical protein IJ805_05150, partial [Lachnospiraceae bacterium]|nr:hypothetical protein [Lachnospiraceae bacterium]
MKNNKSNVNKQHNKKLLVEVVILMAILFINVILINGAAIFLVFYQGLISNLEEIIPDYYEKITATHLSTDSYEFMVDYFTNN